MASVTIFSAMLLFVAVVFFLVIPWMFKLAILYGLHSSRDDAYELARHSPSLAGTRMYKDVLLIHTHAIYLVREQGAQAALHYFTRYTREKRADVTALEIYRHETSEMCRAAEGQRALAELMRLFRQARGLVALRVATCHPLATGFFSVVLLAMGCQALFRLITASRPADDDGRQLAVHYALAHS